MRRTVAALVMLLLPLASPVSASADEDARKAAGQFGAFLTGGRAADLRAVLPATGRVQLGLRVLGTENGSFGPDQTLALLQEAISRRQVRGYDVRSVDTDERRYALIRARIEVGGSDADRVTVGLHLAFHLEEDRWVVREIRETAP